MNPHRFRLFLLFFLAVILFLACPVRAHELTAGEIIDLFKLGFPEEEIRIEVQAIDPPISLTPEDRQALREAGASEDFISLFTGQPDHQVLITITEVADLVATGLPVGEILDRIAAGAEPLSLTGAVALARAEAHLAVIMALQARSLTTTDLKRLGPTGLPLDDYRKLLKILGFTGHLSAADALSLQRAGVPAEIIADVRKASVVVESPETIDSARVESPEHVDFPPEKQPRDLKPAILTEIEDGFYTHPGRRFRVNVPEGWILLRDIDEGQVRYTFTPEKEKNSIDDLEIGLAIQLSPFDRESVYGDKSPTAILEYLLPAIAALEPGMFQEGAVDETMMGSVPGARALFHGNLKDKEGEFTVEVNLAEKDGVVYTVVAMAPRAGFVEIRPMFEKILTESQFQHLDYARRGTPMEESELVARYKGSVVYVETEYEGLGNMGQGTGFIISRDGYVLTNWHVVWDMDNDRPGKSFTIHWDDSLKRPPVKAELIGVDQRPGRSGAAIGGVDVALLKIPPGDYEPVPLSPSSEVRLGDSVLALGFPKSFDLTGLSMFITKGVLVRFNRALDGNLESLTTDAKITHGNSGGPCLSLATGGVVGLNTWGNTQKDYAGYSFLCPTDAALARFSLVADAGLSAEQAVDFLDSFELAHLFVGMKGFRDAVQMAERAVSLQPDSPDAHTLLAICLQALGMDYMERWKRDEAMNWLKKARTAFESALERDSEHPDALVGFTAFLLGMGELEKAAAMAASTVTAHPDLWTAHFLAAQAAAGNNRMEEALGHLDRAREVTRGIVPQVFILMGEIHYQQGKIAQGRAAYQSAVQLHPGNLGARIGLARSFELEKQWDQAIDAYQNLLGDFPRHYEVLYRIGLCQRNKGDLDAAVDAFLRAAQTMETAGEAASENFYFEYAEVLVEKGGSREALRNLAMLMDYYGTSPGVVDAHLKAAEIYVKDQAMSLASAHYNMAVLAGKEFERSIPTPSFQLQDLDLNGIRALMRLRYPPLVIKNVIESNRIDVDVAGTVAKIAREQGIQELNLETLQPIIARIAEELDFPLEVVFWMFNSNLNHQPAQQDQFSGPEIPDDTQGVQPSAFVGEWEAQGMIPYVGYFQSWIVFRPDGTFSYRTQIGYHMEQGGGTYQFQRDVITQYFSETGQTFHRHFQVIGPNEMSIYHAEINQWITWVRRGMAPPAWR